MLRLNSSFYKLREEIWFWFPMAWLSVTAVRRLCMVNACAADNVKLHWIKLYIMSYSFRAHALKKIPCSINISVSLYLPCNNPGKQVNIHTGLLGFPFQDPKLQSKLLVAFCISNSAPVGAEINFHLDSWGWRARALISAQEVVVLPACNSPLWTELRKAPLH